MITTPKLIDFQIGPELRAKVEGHIFDAVFNHVRGMTDIVAQQGVPVISVTKAKEILVAALPQYRDSVSRSMPSHGASDPLPASTQAIGRTLHAWLADAGHFFSHEGAESLRAAIKLGDADERFARVWGDLFTGRLVSHIQQAGLLEQGKLQLCDILVECTKLWIRDVLAQLDAVDSELDPAYFFLSTETDLEATLEWSDQKLIVRGRPDGVILSPKSRRPEVIEYKFGVQGQLEVQIAQVVFYLALLNATHGPGLENASLKLFQVKGGGKTDFPPSVEAAFEGYVGNEGAVRRVMIEATVARQNDPPRMPVNMMFCGPGGLGKTELARRVAQALQLPFVDIPARNVRNVDELTDFVRRELATHDLSPVEAGKDSGLPLLRYPPLVIFMDEVHELGRRSDAFLNFFEPKERRAVGKEEVGDFSQATILAATTDRGRLPDPFLTRFRMVDLVAYSPQEVAKMIEPLFAEYAPSSGFLETLATMARANPRVAKERAGEIITHFRFDAHLYPLTEDGLLRLADEIWHVDRFGLTKIDYEYLRALSSGPRGLGALTSLLPVGADEIRNVIEPYLLHTELVTQTSSGRRLTESGRTALARYSSA